jgi:hypothetical protein
MTTLTARLNKLITNDKFYYFFDNNLLINTLLEAININYKFTQTQINNFLQRSRYGDNDYNDSFLISENADYINIIKYIFANHEIPSHHIIYICQNYAIYKFKIPYIDYLFEYNMNIPNECLPFLLIDNYKYYDVKHYTKSHKNLLFIVMISIKYKKHDVLNKCMELLSKDTTFNKEYFIFMCDFFHDPVIYGDFTTLLDNICHYSNSDEIYTIIAKEEIKMHDDNKDFFYYIINKFGYTEKSMKYALSNGEDDWIFELILNGYNLTVEDINLRLTYGHIIEPINPNKYKFLKLKNKKVFGVITLFKIFNVSPNIDTLNISCKKGYTNEISSLIKDYNIMPQKETLDKSILSMNDKNVAMILNFKILPDETTFSMLTHIKYISDTLLHPNDVYCYINLNDYVINAVELLIIHGFKIKFEHVEFLLSKRLHLKDLSRFEIPYDNKLYFACFTYGYFPWPEIHDNLPKLRQLCMSKKLKYDKLIDFMKVNNVRLNKYDLHFLMRCNKKIGIEIMNKYILNPSIITVYEFMNDADSNIIKNVIKEHNITEQDMLKQYHMDI